MSAETALPAQAADPALQPKPRGLLMRLIFGARPLLYVLPILAAMVGSFALHIRKDGIFSCPAVGYGGDHYLTMCDGTAYGDYDHGAFWFNLEPTARAAAAKADVVFIGPSRTNFGFSTPALGAWFAHNDLNYYVLGFSYWENMNFYGPLLRDMHAKAKVVVINADDFFTDKDGVLGGQLLRKEVKQPHYETKKAWQPAHQMLCGAIPKLCGDRIVWYRQRQTGEWIRYGTRNALTTDVTPSKPVDADLVKAALPSAQKFYRELADMGIDRSCVILTYVPTTDNRRDSYAELAKELGADLISPIVPGLQTFDGSHLNVESSALWVPHWLDESGPRIQKCFQSKVASAAQPEHVQ